MVINNGPHTDVILYQVPKPSSIRSQFRLFNDDLLNGSYCNYLEYLKLTLARRRSIVEIRASYPLASTNAKNNQLITQQDSTDDDDDANNDLDSDADHVTTTTPATAIDTITSLTNRKYV